MLKKSLIFIAGICLTLLLALHTAPAHAEESGDKTVDQLFDKGAGKDSQKNEKDKTEKTSSSKSLKEGTETPSPSVSIFDFVKMIGALLFVIFLIYALVKFMNKRNRLLKPFQYVENIGGAPLGQNRSVQLVKVGNRVLVVGVGENIQLLKEIDDEQDVKEILAQHEAAMNSKIEWQKWVDQVKGPGAQKRGGLPSFSESLKAQLAELKQNHAKGRKKGQNQHE
ncbi:flagella biosynthesis regulatory protein FliZ [Bacillus glycinifermentans]|uniref:Flagella biosynthesis protein FliZ n=1 Tax=Bacillus glycinifermentans TaxID=1664069 RepID=A0AAJ4D262_9BACI|nr:flagella biosynthesis regulatory protein FliZ [Bacillus glycinifermentans]NUJ17143.1 flagella biosynthesis regulatory protein FliZ [Bacillus glycinifermentans]QAT65130.1 flagella biosynthesis protein FliZ [Bacillus glycinifermentans]